MKLRIPHRTCPIRIRRQIACALLVVFTVGLSLPSPAGGLTVKEEEELGREVMQIVKAQFELIDDPVIVDYVNHVGDKIVNTLPTQPFTYRFFVIKQDVYNAFATPAGNIFIYSGLIEAMEDESELAGILGHEAAHVYCRHISQSIERSKKTNMATLAGIAAGIFLGTAGAGEAGQALVVGSMAAGQTAALSYSRENEMQADQVGLKYLHDAGYTGEGLITVLKKIRSKRWFGSDQIPTYLMTHPAVEERIAYLDTYLANRKPSKPAAADSTNESKFPYIRARLAALYGDEAAAVRDFKTAVEQQPDDPVAQYGYGLALTRAGRRPLAIEHLKKALARQPFNPEILTALGKTYFLDGQYREAEGTFEGVLSIAAEYPEALFYVGRTQMEMGDMTAAQETFNTLLRVRPRYPQLHYFLGNVYGKQGQLADAHFHLGLHYLDSREYRNAQVQLERALRESTDPKQKQQIEKLLQQLKKRAPSEEKAKS